MGAFFLIKTNDGGEPSDNERELARCLTEQGFVAPTVLSAADRRLYLYPKHNTETPSLHKVDAENFCAATGTLLYKSKLGTEALEALFDDHRAGTVSAEDLFGCFCVVFCIDCRFEIFIDGLGVYPVWHDRDFATISSSFLAIATAQAKLTIEPQSVYEYVFQGATYGWRTVFEEIATFDGRQGLVLDGAARRCPPLPAPARARVSGDLAAHVERNVDNIRRYYKSIVAAFGDRVDTALSGGYDSRLTLALLREQGAAPNIHVYGREADADVQIAKAVSAGEGFPLKHQDKSGYPRVAPDAFAEVVRQNYLNFNGYPVDGLFDNGSDLATRWTRCAGGELMLNGGGGEIYRNFFYLPDGGYRVRDLLWSFYNRFDPKLCTAAFDETTYHANLGGKIKDVLRLDGERMTREQVEFLYVGFRCRFWMGLNNGVNNRFGWSLTPFIDPATVADANAVPLRFKNYGQLEAAMIATISPALAAYPSDYGHDFAGPVPLKRKLEDWSTMLRPPRLRRYFYRLKTYSRDGWPYYLSDDYVGSVIDIGFPIMNRFMKVGAVADAAPYNRICSLEYLFQQTGAQA